MNTWTLGSHLDEIFWDVPKGNVGGGDRMCWYNFDRDRLGTGCRISLQKRSISEMTGHLLQIASTFSSTWCTQQNIDGAKRKGVSGMSIANVDVNPRIIYSTIHTFLAHCKLTYPEGDPNAEFVKLCKQEAIRRGYPMEGPASLERFIPPGAIMARYVRQVSSVLQSQASHIVRHTLI